MDQRNQGCVSWKCSQNILFLVLIISTVVSANYYNGTNSLYRGFNSHSASRQTKDIRIPEAPGHNKIRNSKLFPLFTLIRFANEICRTTSEETGVCYTRSQCNALGGSAQGNCASGLGVCCRFVASCGAIVYQNGTSFQNPNYPSKYVPMGGSDVCQVRVRKQHNICQLRLNFIAFDIEGPSSAPTNAGGGAANAGNEAGVCKTDSLAITSSGATVPSLCGNMNGQHLYVDFGSSDTITLNLLLGGASQKERTWNIEIITVSCNAVSRAPSGCLQYFTGVSGQVESFNFQGGQHLANLDYSICLRMEDGMRFVDWIPCTQNAVRIGGGTATPPTAPTMNIACPAALPDYLIIAQGINYPIVQGNQNQNPLMSTTDRFCDVSFQATGSYVRTSAKPYLMHVRTDMSEGIGNDLASVGFCFRWQQNPQ